MPQEMHVYIFIYVICIKLYIHIPTICFFFFSPRIYRAELLPDCSGSRHSHCQLSGSASSPKVPVVWDTSSMEGVTETAAAKNCPL